jgi:hypothetical protein
MPREELFAAHWFLLAGPNVDSSAKPLVGFFVG